MKHDPELIRAAAALGDQLVPRRTREETALAMFDCSQTMRRLAHRLKREALEWEAKGNLVNYHACRTESDRYWRTAKWNLQQARLK